MLLTVTKYYQQALFRLCAASIAHMCERAARTAELRDHRLRCLLRGSGQRLLGAPLFASGVVGSPDAGSAGSAAGDSADAAACGADTPMQSGQGARGSGASIDWSEVGYDPRYRGVRRLEHQEELRFIMLAKAGDTFARQKLTVHYLPLLQSVARRYRGRGLTLSELVNEGTFGLQRALQRFDCGRRLRFGTYAKWWMRDAMEQALATQGRLVRLPANVLRDLRKKGALQQREDNTSAPVAAGEGGAVDEAVELPEREVDWDGEIGVDDATPEVLVAEGQQLRLLAQALAQLSGPEQAVLVRRFGLNGKEPGTLTSTGEELRLSHERVRQIQEAALAKLRALLGLRSATGVRGRSADVHRRSHGQRTHQ